MSKARILAIDADAELRSALEALLVEEGYEVRVAGGGDEALQCLEADRFDVVITDLELPDFEGCAFIRRLKERVPDQEILVLTGVDDLGTAVEAMKHGAADYQRKPLEGGTLIRALDVLLQRRRLREEHARLMAENLEYLNVLSVYERALSLHSTLAVGSLAERIVEGLCLETRAQGGVLWLAEDGESDRLELAGSRGLVRLQDEPERLSAGELPPQALAGAPVEGAPLPSAEPLADPQAPLWIPLRRGTRLLALARLTDRLGGQAFGERERAWAQKLADLAAPALANALRLRALERRSLRDPITRAYTSAYFEDVVRNEIQKAQRFGRQFALVKLELEGLEPLRARVPELDLGRLLEAVVHQAARSLRSTDLLACESENRYCVMLPESDALGAALLKRRIREELLRSEALAGLEPELRLRPLLSAVSFPADGTHLDALTRVLDARLDGERSSLARQLEREAPSFAACVEALLARATPGPRELPEQVARFVLEDVGRRPRERGLLFVAPGASLLAAVRGGLQRLCGLQPATEIVLLGEGEPEALNATPVHNVPRVRSGTRVPFLLRFGEGPAYALLREREDGDGSATFFHTSDRALVEHLVFQLQGELGVPVAL